MTSFGQKPIYNSELNADSNYIKSYSDVFTPRFVLINKRNEFTITNTQPDSTDNRVNELIFRPNDPLNIGFGFTYKWLGLNMAFNLPFINNDDEIYGKTRRFDLSTHIYGRKLIFDLNYQWYKGYYLANPQGVVPGWQEGDPYPHRSDITVTTFGGAGFYVFNHKRFSYRAAFTFNERQKKSAGSWVIGGGFGWNFTKGDSSLVNSDFIVELDSVSIEKARLGTMYTTGGYAHSFVIKNFFLSLTLGLGFGLSNDRLEVGGVSQEVVKKIGFNVVTVFRASFGYNSDDFYIGFTMYNNAYALSPQDNIGLSYSYTSFNIYAGYRFYKLFKKKEPLPWLWDLKI